MQRLKELMTLILKPTKTIQTITFVTFSIMPIILCFVFMFKENDLLKYLIISLLFIGCLNPVPKNRIQHILFLIPFSSLFHFGQTFGFFTICVGICVVLSYCIEIYKLIRIKKLVDKDYIYLLSLSLLFLMISIVTSVIVGTDRTNLISLANFILYLLLFIYISYLIREKIINPSIFEICIIGFAIASLISWPSVISEVFYNKLYIMAGKEHVIVYKSIFLFNGSLKFLAFTGLQTEPNYLGFTMIVSICGSFALGVLEKSFSLRQILIIVVCAISGFLTLSTTFLLCFIFLALAFLVHKIMNLKTNRYLISIILLSLLAIGLLVFSNMSPFDLSYTADNVRLFVSSFTTGRSELAILSVEQFCSSILIFFFGRGWNNLQLIYDAHASHSLLFDCLNSVGLIGLFLIIYIFVLLIKALNKSHSISTKGKEALIVILLFPIVFELMSLPSFGSWFFLLPFFCVIVPLLISKKEKKLNENKYTIDI